MQRYKFWLLIQYVLLLAMAGCGTNVNTLDHGAIQNHINKQKTKAQPEHRAFMPASDPLSVQAEPQEYQLGASDVIRISIIGHEALDTVQAVRPDGFIAFYPMGDVLATGRTVEELRQDIISRLRAKTDGPYLLGIQDVISISVYEQEELNTVQAVSPDGTISILPGGAIQVAGKTIHQVQELVSKRTESIIREPLVNVVVMEYKSQPLYLPNPVVNIVVQEFNSKRVAIVGEVDRPGIIKLRSPVSIVEAISEAGGFSEQVDLSKTIIFRDGEILPISFEQLFKRGDITQNITLKPRDTIFVASTSFNRIFILGQVRNPGTVTWEGSLGIIEAIATAGGYLKDAEASHVLIIKDGLSQPTLHLIDASKILGEGLTENNILLESGDVVFVPQTRLATAERYFEAAVNLLRPVLAVESAIILGDSVDSVLQGDGPSSGTTLNLNP